MNCGWHASTERSMSSLSMEFRDEPSEATGLVIVATSAATEAAGPPIVKTSNKLHDCEDAC